MNTRGGELHRVGLHSVSVVSCITSDNEAVTCLYASRCPYDPDFQIKTLVV